MKNCIACDDPLEGATVTCIFEGGGLTTRSLNGTGIRLHARCISINFRERGIELAPRISDPVAEPELVTVEQDGSDWHTVCREHGLVALKDNQPDAALGAVYHIARVHIDINAPATSHQS